MSRWKGTENSQYKQVYRLPRPKKNKILYLTKRNCRWVQTTQLPTGLDEAGPEKKRIKFDTLYAPDEAGEDGDEGFDTHLLLDLTYFNW